MPYEVPSAYTISWKQSSADTSGCRWYIVTLPQLRVFWLTNAMSPRDQMEKAVGRITTLLITQMELAAVSAAGLRSWMSPNVLLGLSSQRSCAISYYQSPSTRILRLVGQIGPFLCTSGNHTRSMSNLSKVMTRHTRTRSTVCGHYQWHQALDQSCLW